MCQIRRIVNTNEASTTIQTEINEYKYYNKIKWLTTKVQFFSIQVLGYNYTVVVSVLSDEHTLFFPLP